MLSELIVNFCVLVTMMYILSSSYRNAQEVTDPGISFPRLMLVSLMAAGLMFYPAPVAPGFFIDMRGVPLAYLALRKGVVAGLLGLIPLLVIRCFIGGGGVTGAVFSAVGMAVIGGWQSGAIDLFACNLDWRKLWWRILLVFLPNGLLLPLLRQDLQLYWSVYLPLLVLSLSGFGMSLGILRNRYRLLSLLGTYEQQAYQDSLCELPNRRQFDLDMPRLGPSDLLCLIDIDHFKRVNDTYGHATGDAVLAQVGRVLKERLRASDRAYRYGGEEFAVVFHTPATTSPFMLAERIRQAVQATRFDMLPEQMPLTVSIGVARRDTGLVKDCFARADAALYAAKEQGRNRVVVWSPELAAN